MKSFIQRLFRRKPAKPPCYVIIYDEQDEQGGYIEQYYGYFSSPDEARQLWNEFKGPGLAEELYQNVKLCRVVEDWS